MEITADRVKELRQRTGIGVMECKEALAECQGDIEKAIAALRKKGAARAQERMNREASQGIVHAYIHLEGKLGVLVEVNCESDFVARNDEFKELAKNIAMQIAAANPRFVSSADIPATELEQEKEIIRAQLQDIKKPPQIIEKIVDGNLDAQVVDFLNLLGDGLGPIEIDPVGQLAQQGFPRQLEKNACVGRLLASHRSISSCPARIGRSVAL